MLLGKVCPDMLDENINFQSLFGCFEFFRKNSIKCHVFFQSLFGCFLSNIDSGNWKRNLLSIPFWMLRPAVQEIALDLNRLSIPFWMLRRNLSPVVNFIGNSFQSLFGCFFSQFLEIRQVCIKHLNAFNPFLDASSTKVNLPIIIAHTFNPFSDASVCFIYPFSLIYSLPINKFLIPMDLYHATDPRCNYRLVFRSHGSTLKLKASHVFINVQLVK